MRCAFRAAMTRWAASETGRQRGGVRCGRPCAVAVPGVFLCRWCDNGASVDQLVRPVDEQKVVEGVNPQNATTQPGNLARASAAAQLSRQIRVALVGCGAVATQYYVPALRELERAGKATVVALFDPAADRMSALQDTFTQAVCLGDVSEVGKLGVELAVVASPPRFHAEQSIQLLQAGCAVLCEKPLATDVAEGEAMVAAAVATQQMLASGLVRRFFPAAESLRTILAEQGLGAVRSFTWQEGDHFRWPTQSAAFFRRAVAKGGVLLDIGVHVLDLLIWWWGPPVDVAYEDDAMGGVEANCRIRLTFAQGHSGEVRLSRDWPLANRCLIHCARVGWVGHSTKWIKWRLALLAPVIGSPALFILLRKTTCCLALGKRRPPSSRVLSTNCSMSLLRCRARPSSRRQRLRRCTACV